MAGVVETTNTFATNDVITSTAMNNIIDQTLFTSDALSGSTLALVAGKMKVATSGITSNEMGVNAVTSNALASDAVTTAKILDANVTPSKLANSDFGDFTVASGVATLDSNVVTTAKVADANITASKLSGAQTGTAPVYGMRAYVVFDASRNAAGATDSLNTTRFLISSGNVASVTKTASGAFTVAFTTALPNANYAYFGTSRVQSGSDILVFRADGGTKTTTAFQFVTMSRGGSATNPEDCSLVFIG
jgi:hypothetical protein